MGRFIFEKSFSERLRETIETIINLSVVNKIYFLFLLFFTIVIIGGSNVITNLQTNDKSLPLRTRAAEPVRQRTVIERLMQFIEKVIVTPNR